MEPSKQYFYWAVANWFSGRSYSVALDAAAADFKNAGMIPSKLYVGVDIDKESLERGLEKHGSGIAIASDVTELRHRVAEYSVDLCISTHTIYYLAEEQVYEFISDMATLNSRGGDLIFNIHRDVFDRLCLHDLLRSRYEHTVARRYRNVLSRLYESRATRDDQGRYITSTKILQRLVNRLLSIAERLPVLRKSGDRVLVMSSGSLNYESTEFRLLDQAIS